MKTSFLAPLLWLLLVLALIPLVLLLLKRSGLANRLAGRLGMPRSAAPLLVLRESLSIGPNQRVVAIEVGSGEQRQCLLLGVTAQQISTLHTLALPAAPEVAAAPAAPAAAGFDATTQPLDLGHESRHAAAADEMRFDALLDRIRQEVTSEPAAGARRGEPMPHAGGSGALA